MQTIKTHKRTGSDGSLTLRIPLGTPDTEFELVVVAQAHAKISLPPGYYDLLGSLDDDTFVIHPQPALPPAVEIE